MLVIKPLPNREIQKKLSEQCNGMYLENALAYIAMDCEEDGETLKSVIGICQFSFWNGDASMHQLACIPGVQDEEALMIMARTAMNFLFRCGIRKLTVSEQDVPAALLEKLDFRKQSDGLYFMDLVLFYQSPCHYQPDLTNS